MTSSVTERRRSRPTSDATCILPRTRAGTSTPIRQNACRRSPGVHGQTPTTTSSRTATSSTVGRRVLRRPARSIRAVPGPTRTSVARAPVRRSLTPSSVDGERGRTTGSLACRCSRKLCRRVSVEVGYYRRWWPIFGGADVTDNVLVSPADYSQFAVIAPSDAKLPNGGGYQVPGIYNITQAGVAKGQENVQTGAKDYGDYKRYWDGFDITAQARLRNGLTLQGGTSSGRLVEDICDVRSQVPELTSGTLASPTIPYCRQHEPMLTTFKGLFSYLIPKIDVQVAGHVLEPSWRQSVRRLRSTRARRSRTRRSRRSVVHWHRWPRSLST